MTPAHAAGARALAARLLPHLDATAESLGALRPWHRRRALRELLARALAEELAAEPRTWSELRERQVLAALRAMIDGPDGRMPAGHPGRYARS